MPLTKATTNVVNLDKDTLINGLTVGKGGGNISTNTAIGLSALNSNTTGYQNTANGGSALQTNTIGHNNTANGFSALDANTIGVQNTAIGSGGLSLNTTGNSNTAVGHIALYNNTTGNSNTAIGSSALAANTTGYNNAAIGANALSANTTGHSIAAVGALALSNNTIFTNIGGLGYNTQVTASNQVQLGDGATTTYAYGAVQDRSDVRDKTDVRDTELGLEFVNALRPVDFKWDMREDYRPKPPVAPSENATEEEKAAYEAAKVKWLEDVKLANINSDGSKKRNRFHHGLIAQEVKAVLDSKGIDFGGFQDHTIKGGDAVMTIGYTELIGPLIKAVQELSAKVAELEAK